MNFLDLLKNRETVRKILHSILFVLDLLDGKVDGKVDFFKKHENTTK